MQIILLEKKMFDFSEKYNKKKGSFGVELSDDCVS